MNPYYYSFDDQMKERFGGKVYRLALSAARTCPNRDGTCGTGGCIFCSAGGSGDFAESAELSVTEQIRLAKGRVARKLSKNFAGYMAYFQSFTETYGDQQHLASCFREAAAQPEILALSIATRPDCLSEEMIGVLRELNEQKPVFVELGLQTIHEDTAAYINRGYALPVFEDAFRRLKAAGLAVTAHVIIGLPGEEEARTKETVRYLSALDYAGSPLDGIKLQLLHVLKGTALAELLPSPLPAFLREQPASPVSRQTASPVPEPEDNFLNGSRLILNDGQFLICYNILNYSRLITELVAMLPADTAVHRLTGDAPKKLLILPQWTADKKRVMNTITRTFRETGRHQSGRGQG